MIRTRSIVMGALLVACFSIFFAAYTKYAEAPENDACPQDAFMCPDGTLVGRSGPECNFNTCPEQAPEAIPDIEVALPQKNAAIASPISVTGRARGTWFFEASFPVTVVDWDGRIIGEGYVEAADDWMTESFVPFRGTITYALPTDTYSTRGALIFKKDNPSGLPEHDAAYEMQVTLVPNTSPNVPTPEPMPVTPPENPVACTMDAKQCPDGSYVGRVGPHCDFAPCS